MKIFIIGYVVLALASLAGWVMNLVAVVHGIGDPITTKMVLRIVGIFAAPLGAILGYM